MGEGFLKSFDKNLDVVSAGTNPSDEVHPLAIKVMQDEGIDLSNSKPKSVTEFLVQEFDYVITVCGGAKEACPMFTGKVKNHIHIGFDDPAEAKGNDNFVLSEFQRIRDEIKKDFGEFYKTKVQPEQKELICYCKQITKEEVVEAIEDGAETLLDVQLITNACTGNQCADLNPKGVCCSGDIDKLLPPKQTSCCCSFC